MVKNIEVYLTAVNQLFARDGRDERLERDGDELVLSNGNGVAVGLAENGLECRYLGITTQIDKGSFSADVHAVYEYLAQILGYEVKSETPVSPPQPSYQVGCEHTDNRDDYDTPQRTQRSGNDKVLWSGKMTWGNAALRSTLFALVFYAFGLLFAIVTISQPDMWPAILIFFLAGLIFNGAMMLAFRVITITITTGYIRYKGLGSRYVSFHQIQSVRLANEHLPRGKSGTVVVETDVPNFLVNSKLSGIPDARNAFEILTNALRDFDKTER